MHVLSSATVSHLASDDDTSYSIFPLQKKGSYRKRGQDFNYKILTTNKLVNPTKTVNEGAGHFLILQNMIMKDLITFNQVVLLFGDHFGLTKH